MENMGSTNLGQWNVGSLQHASALECIPVPDAIILQHVCIGEEKIE